MKKMQHDFLEDEEEAIRAAMESTRFQPSEEDGLVGIAGAARKTLAVAGAALAIAPNTESPIEATLGARLHLLVDQWNSEGPPALLLVPQYPLHRFRYDFGIVCGGKLVAAIECDGQEFHSSEAAQANDRAKNVAAWQAGAEIFRFTGSMIFRRDTDCVALVEEFLKAQFGRRT